MGSFRTPPISFLYALDVFESRMGDCPPTDYPPVEGFDGSGLAPLCRNSADIKKEDSQQKDIPTALLGILLWPRYHQ